MSANTQEEFDSVLATFAEGYGLTSIERAVMINGINKLRALSTEPRTCKTCADSGVIHCLECRKALRSPQSADVETVREEIGPKKIEIRNIHANKRHPGLVYAHLYVGEDLTMSATIDLCSARAEDIALDRLVGKEEK